MLPYRGGSQRIDVEPYGTTVTISTKGNGRVYYSLVVEGIRTDGRVQMEDRNLQIRRDVLDRSGSPVNLLSIRQNDLVVVRRKPAHELRLSFGGGSLTELRAGIARLGEVLATQIR